MTWTDERTDLLKSLWLGGQPASFIATRLGDVTRNAVIGKVLRLGLRRRDGSPLSLTRSSTTRPRKRNRTRLTRPRNKRPPPPKPQPRPCHPPKENLAEMILRLRTFDCRWPIGDPYLEGFHFCGQHALADLPYCAAHQREGTRPSRRRSSTLSI
jgi:GcrA cell cycle regulator